jgi:hypothetical protein
LLFHLKMIKTTWHALKSCLIRYFIFQFYDVFKSNFLNILQ